MLLWPCGYRVGFVFSLQRISRHLGVERVFHNVLAKPPLLRLVASLMPQTAGISSWERVGIADASNSLSGSGKIWDAVTGNYDKNLDAE